MPSIFAQYVWYCLRVIIVCCCMAVLSSCAQYWSSQWPRSKTTASIIQHGPTSTGDIRHLLDGLFALHWFDSVGLVIGRCKGKKVKECASYLWKSISQLRSVTCRMGSHSVTYHPTQANTPRLHPSWPFKGGGLSKPRPRVQRATGPRLLRDSPGQRDPNTRSSER